MKKTLKLATFNINGITRRVSHLVQWLEKASPDIVCLQELKAADADFPLRAIRNAGYGAIWHGQRSWNGVAILAKDAAPIEVRRALPGNAADDQSRYLEAAVHGILVGCLYLPNGNPQPGPKFDYKLAWLERLIAHAATLYDNGHPVALVGDFNVVPTDFDIYNPRSWKKDALLQPQSRERFQRLLSQGWVDALRRLHPEERIYTFWDYFRQHWERNAGLRIDHLLLNQELAPRLVDAGVDTWVRGLEKPSDHAPAWITLSSPREATRPRHLPQPREEGVAGTDLATAPTTLSNNGCHMDPQSEKQLRLFVNPFTIWTHLALKTGEAMWASAHAAAVRANAPKVAVIPTADAPAPQAQSPAKAVETMLASAHEAAVRNTQAAEPPGAEKRPRKARPVAQASKAARFKAARARVRSQERVRIKPKRRAKR